MIRHSIIAAAVLALAAPALAQPFAIDWHRTAPGGPLAGGTFTGFGVIGQFEAGTTMTGGTFAITGGYLAGSGNAPACVADVDDGSGAGHPDGGVTIDDLLYYIAQFTAGTIRADIDDGSGTGHPDGGVTIDDLLYFVLRFSEGC